MNSSKDKIDGRGKRWEVQVEGYPNEGWSCIGGADTPNGATEMGRALVTAPGFKRFRVLDRLAGGEVIREQWNDYKTGRWLREELLDGKPTSRIDECGKGL